MWKDSETELDFLDYDYLIKTVKSIIENDDLLPASIGVYGDWGSGKSSLMHMCKKQLEDNDKNVKCLVFNGWLFENYEDAKTAIIGSILDAIGEKKRLSKKAKDILNGLYKSIDKFKLLRNGIKYGTEFALTGGVGLLADLTVNSLIKQLPSLTENAETISQVKENIEAELDNKALRDDIHKFQADFAKLIEESKISKLVIFVDELDRCRPDTILETLEAIKLFLFTGKVAFVIGADERHIAYAVKTKFKDIEGIQIDIGKEYLEKLVQYPVRIPRLDSSEMETYIACLLLQNELKTEDFHAVISRIVEAKHENFLSFDILKTVEMLKGDIEQEQFSKIIEAISVARQLSDVLSSGLHGNPRQCKRFLNSLYMRLNMAGYRNTQLNRKVLAKIMLLEYIKPALFNEFAKRSFENILSDELKVAETSGITDEITWPKRWKDDPWFKQWLSTEPKLGEGVDLKIYFYFSRTAIDERISRISATLSPEAQTVLDGLLSKTDIKIKKAIQDSENISDSEAATVLQAFFEKMSGESDIPKEHLLAFIDFVDSRDVLTSEGLEYLEKLTGTQIPMGSLARIAEWAKKKDKVSDIQEITEHWGNSNLKINQAITQLLKE